MFVDSQSKTEVVSSLTRLPNIEELYEVRGNADIISLVSATDINEFRDFMKNDIRKIPGVKNALISIVLDKQKMRE
jgi:DNA-binding Lrp family transcriptional regulator